MNCHLSERDEKIDDYLLGKLSTEEEKAFEIHFFGCTECLEELRLRRQIINLVKNEREELIAGYDSTAIKNKKVFTFKLREHFEWLTRNWKYASIAVVTILVAAIGIQVYRHRSPDVRLYPDLSQFRDNARLESVMRQTFQSSDISVVVRSPENGEVFDVNKNVVFEWKVQRREDSGSQTKWLSTNPLTLKILDNQVKTIHEERVNKRFVLDNALLPGVYYWTLEFESQMLYLGKFYINTPRR